MDGVNQHVRSDKIIVAPQAEGGCDGEKPAAAFDRSWQGQVKGGFRLATMKQSSWAGQRATSDLITDGRFGRVCESTNGHFADAKLERRWLPGRLLWSDPAGTFGSAASGRDFRMQSFNRDRVAVGGREPRMTHPGGRRFLDTIGERPFAEWTGRST
jgi:hypothetical protein